MVHIGVVGDYQPTNETHVATTSALRHAAAKSDVDVEIVWVGADQTGEPRIPELRSHPFFVATLFVPQVSSTPAATRPLVAALIDAATARVATEPAMG